jgi:predicted dehydrogenase
MTLTATDEKQKEMIDSEHVSRHDIETANVYVNPFSPGSETVAKGSNSPIVFIRGTGSIGMRHLHVFRDLLGVRAIAVPRRPDRVQSLQNEGYEAVSSLPKATRGKDSFLVVATDTDRHLEDALEGIKEGYKAILIEKPITPSVAGISRLRTASSSINDRVFVGCNLRFDAGLNVFREMLPRIGDIHHVRIEAQSFLPDWRPTRNYKESYSADPQMGGVLRDLIHEIDYAVWLFGKPSSVTALLLNTGSLKIAAEESADVLWRTPSGASISIRLDYITRHYRRVMTAFGNRGDLTCDLATQIVKLQLAESELVTIKCPQDRNEAMREQADSFLCNAMNGSSCRLATFEDGAFAIALCDAARRSSISGRTELIDDEWRIR